MSMGNDSNQGEESNSSRAQQQEREQNPITIQGHVDPSNTAGKRKVVANLWDKTCGRNLDKQKISKCQKMKHFKITKNEKYFKIPKNEKYFKITKKLIIFQNT